MRIDTAVPTHIARAYGLKLVRPAADTRSPAPSQPSQPMKPAAPSTPTKPMMAIQPTSAAEPAGKVNQLIAGQVAGPVEFSAGPRAVAKSDAIQLYTRSADRIEAATAVQIGRQLDVKA